MMWALFVFAVFVVAVVLVLVSLIYARSNHRKSGGKAVEAQPLLYSLKIADFVESFIEIPTSTVTIPTSTIDSSYLVGRAPLYNAAGGAGIIVGVCSASFLNMQSTDDTIFTDISNFIETIDGLIVTWFTPTNLLNLALDSVVNGMVTEAIVTVTTKVGASRFFGNTYTLVVSSDGQNINFKFIPRH
jgi:hypothetical protein